MTYRLPATDEELRCIEFADLVTAYLEGTLDEAQRNRIDAHLAGCQGCRAAVEQYRTLKAVAGRLTAADVADLDPFIRDRLLSTLRIPRKA